VSVHQTIKVLTDKLFEPEMRRLNQVIQGLNVQNKRLKDAKIDGFLFQGTYFLPTGISATVAAQTQAKVGLHPTLYPAMKAFLQDRTIVENERKYISQTILHLLSSCKTRQEIRNALPECLVMCLPELKVHARTNSEAYTIQSDPRALHQYEEILPKMELYAAGALFY